MSKPKLAIMAVLGVAVSRTLGYWLDGYVFWAAFGVVCLACGIAAGILEDHYDQA